MEGCAVCTCDEEEIPVSWRAGSLYDSKVYLQNDGGWISNTDSIISFEGYGHSESLSKVEISASDQSSAALSGGYSSMNKAQRESPGYFQYLHQTENCESDLWTAGLSHDEHSAPISQVGVYVNLLNNPERFTGYAGPSAARVWTAIHEENCFGPHDDLCLEKRIFARVISGLRSSISVHLSRTYLHPNGSWGENLPLYWERVGNYPDRLNNMYFAFLFLLRAAAKASPVLQVYPYHTGNNSDDALVTRMMTKLVDSLQGSKEGVTLQVPMPSVAECSYAFDESVLFQVADSVTGPSYWQQLEEKHSLREEFRLKFRNISRIMDCVTCEKCRVWGKLQILGFGTAVKLLLTSEAEIHAAAVADGGASLLNRQEVIALVNTLNQFSKSVQFATHAFRVRNATAVPALAIDESSAIGQTWFRGAG